MRPLLPPALAAPAPGTTGPQISERQRLHNLQVAMLHEANHIKHTILNQIQEACNETVLNTHINNNTGMLMGTVIEILQYLFDTYGKITNQKIAEEHQRVMQHKYVHNDPIANVFFAITTYDNMIEAHGTPETNKQLISIGKKSFWPTPEFFWMQLKNGIAFHPLTKHGRDSKPISPQCK